MLNPEIDAFSQLGIFLKNYLKSDFQPINSIDFTQEYEDFNNLIEKLPHHNGWFTRENILLALNSWEKVLEKEKLAFWVSTYKTHQNTKTVGLVLAGNIPMVGFHDVLSVLISGHKVLIKLSTQDNLLIPFLLNILTKIDSNFKEKIKYTKEKLTDFDAIIATGSNNTARYFEYYFRDKPHIIRKSRNSVAILNGKETTEDLNNLGKDIFTYFGLGCRNVSKLYVPENYNFTTFFESIYSFNNVTDTNKYANNYDYNKTVYLMNAIPLFDNNFLILKEDNAIASPLGVLFYEYYKTLDTVLETLETQKENIQCVVSNFVKNTINFGNTQEPSLLDYADGVDTMEFLNG